MASVRDWLQLFRSHTSPLEVTIALLGAVLAAGTLLDVRVLLVALLGWLYHNAGYGQNSVEDFAAGYDSEDPHKSHHPLQRGAISISEGRRAVNTLLAVFFIYSILLLYPSRTGIAIFLVMYACGVMYNKFGKSMKLKFVPIAIAHSLLFPVGFFAAGGTANMDWASLLRNRITYVLILGFLYFVIQIVYQILIEGDLKDIECDEATMLDWLGIKLENGELRASLRARITGTLLKTLNIIIALEIIRVYGMPTAVVASWAVISTGILMFNRKLLATRRFYHGETLKDMAVMEVLSVFLMVFALAPAMAPGNGGILAAGAVVVLDISYFVVMNRYLWGTVVTPRV